MSKLFSHILTFCNSILPRSSRGFKDPTRDKQATHRKRFRENVYGRRLARPLRNKRQQALDYGLKNHQIKPDDIKSYDFSKETWLEIGFGYGEHLTWQAEQNPSVSFIGCEPFLNGVSVCMMDLQEKDLTNVKIWPDDARKVLKEIPENSISKLFVLHPDPWPKKRHHKRRFIQAEMLDHFAKIMKDGVILRMASDHKGVAEWMRDKAIEHPLFQQCPENAKDWTKRPENWPQTRYELKGLKAGREPRFMVFKLNKNAS